MFFMNNSINYCGSLVYSIMTTTEKEEFSAYVLRILNEKGIKELHAAQSTGNRIDQTTINKLKNGLIKVENVRSTTIYWLAKALDEPPIVVFSKALGISLRDLGIREEQTSEMLELNNYLTQLAPNRVKDLLTIVRALYMNDKSEHTPVAPQSAHGEMMTVEEALADNERKTGGKKKAKK